MKGILSQYMRLSYTLYTQVMRTLPTLVYTFPKKGEQKALYDPHKKQYFIFLNRTAELALMSTQARGEGLSVRLGDRELCALRGG